MSSELPSRALSQIAAFARLATRSGRHIPLVAQAAASDCGPACLAMVLEYHGRRLPIDAVRAAVGGAASGVSARQLADGARRLHLRARGVKLELNALRYLPRATILHWEMNHFVVLESVDRRGARIVDPSSGPRRVSLEDLADRCTGIALLLEPAPEFATPQHTRSPRRARQLRWLRAAPGYFPRVIALSAVLQLAVLSIPATLGLCVDKVIPRHDGQLLQLLAAGALIVWSVQILTSYVRSSLLLHLRTYLDAQLTIDLNEHVLGLPFSFFQRRSAGDLVMRLGSSAQIRELLTSGALSAILDGSVALLYFALLCALAPPLAVIALGVALLQVLCVWHSGRRNAELMSEQLVAQARLSSAQGEALAVIEPIKSMGAEGRIAERWADLYVDVLNVALDRGRLANRVSTATQALGFAGPLAILLSGAQLVLSGSLDLGAMLALSSVGAAFLTPVATLMATWTQVQTLQSYLGRLEDILDTPREPPSSAVRPRLPGEITLDAVSFAYATAGPLVLDRVSLQVRAHEFVAIVGASGSGKSTLARLLAGLYTPVSGTIQFGGADAKCADPTELRGSLGIVTQDTRLVAATIRDNISLFDPSVPLERVQHAARLAEIHDDVMQLPLGYDTVLSDGGGSLSGGQRQRLALARALLRDPTLLILDEATSQLDQITERRVQRQLAALSCTRIVIAHRLSTICDADRVIVLGSGRVIDIGSHADLLARCANYRALVTGQSHGAAWCEESARGQPSVTEDHA